jgi:hypothetical protein
VGRMAAGSPMRRVRDTRATLRNLAFEVDSRRDGPRHSRAKVTRESQPAAEE